MKARLPIPLHRRAETWLWTGPAGHLVGGTLDLLGALASYMLASARENFSTRR